MMLVILEENRNVAPMMVGGLVWANRIKNPGEKGAAYRAKCERPDTRVFDRCKWVFS